MAELSTPGDAGPEITISTPASSAYLSVLRTAAAALAAGLDFTIDEIEDLRIVVDEGCTILLDHALPDAVLAGRFDPDAGRVVVSLSTTSDTPPPREPKGFSWTVLSGLAEDVQLLATPGDRSGVYQITIVAAVTTGRVDRR